MDAHDLLRTWPDISETDPEGLLSHPAWRLPCSYGDEEVGLALVADEEDPDGLHGDELLISVTLDSAPCVLGLRNAAVFPDLNRLWARRAELPEALVIALVEKEAGALLQLVENMVRRELRVVGLADVASAHRRIFGFACGGGEVSFSLDLPQDAVPVLGVLGNLDVGHESIRSLARPVRAEYAVIDLGADSERALAVGDCLLPGDRAPKWTVDSPQDDLLRVRAVADESFTFGAFADDALPAVPDPERLSVFRNGRIVASAIPIRVGDAPVFKVTEVL